MKGEEYLVEIRIIPKDTDSDDTAANYLGLQSVLIWKMDGVFHFGWIYLKKADGSAWLWKENWDGCGVNMIFGRLMEQVTFIITQIQIGSFGILPI